MLAMKEDTWQWRSSPLGWQRCNWSLSTSRGNRSSQRKSREGSFWTIHHSTWKWLWFLRSKKTGRMIISCSRRNPMKCHNDTSQYQPQQRGDAAKHQPSHTTLTTTDSGADNNNYKPVLILAVKTPAIDQLKATIAIIPTGIQLLRNWIRRPRYNWSETTNVYGVSTKHSATRIAENHGKNHPWSA